MDRLRWLIWGVAGLPYFCGCTVCPTTALCFAAALLLAAAGFALASLARELAWLRALRER